MDNIHEGDCACSPAGSPRHLRRQSANEAKLFPFPPQPPGKINFKDGKNPLAEGKNHIGIVGILPLFGRIRIA
jgi:hypothetical protein